MKVAKIFLKLPLFLLTIALFILSSGIVGLLISNEDKLLRVRTNIVSFFCGIGLKILQIRVFQEGIFPKKTGKFIISNHLSYVDILILSAKNPSCFVTSNEIKETPFLGLLCKLGGCIFIERRNKENIHNEVQVVSEKLKKGFNVTIFPEATSTNGESVLRFRKPFYQAPLNSKSQILPVCLKYTKINNKPLTNKNRNLICWYGDMDFLPHLIGLLKLSEITAKVVILKLIEPIQADRQSLANHTHQIISNRYMINEVL